MVPNQGDGWAHAIDELARYYDRAWARSFGALVGGASLDAGEFARICRYREVAGQHA